jgi:hypothetical protein
MRKNKEFFRQVKNDTTNNEGQTRGSVISNHGHLARHTTAFLLVCCLIMSLPSGCAKAHDQAANINMRANTLINTFESYDVHLIETPHNNARYGTLAAAARLRANDGNDPAMIKYITEFYDVLSPGQPGYWTTLSGVAWVLGNYWDKFTPAQRDHLKARLKGLSNLTGHGTENHALNKAVAGYLYAQYWPGETGWINGELTSAELMSICRTNLLNVISSLYDKGLNEDLSTTYIGIHLYPYYVLYDCATDPKMKKAADAAITFHVAHLAANHFEGVVIPPFNRENAPQRNINNGAGWVPALQWNYWLYWAEAQNKIPGMQNFISNKENRWVIHAALSDWRPPAAINSLAFGKTVPYELRSSKSKFGEWGTGSPAEYERYVYRDKSYAMGSGNMQFRPDGYHLDYNMFGIIYKSGDTFNYIDCHHPYWRSNHRSWLGASPFIQMAQHKSTAIVLFNIPDADPWSQRGGSYLDMRNNFFDNLIQEGLVRYPKSVDSKAEANGWIFLREGSVYIAIRPLKAYTIDPNYYTLLTKSGSYLDNFVDAVAQFNVVRSAFGQTGFVFDIGTKEEFSSFTAFQTTVSQNQLEVDWDNFSVTYTSLGGNTLRTTWKTPVPDYKDVQNNNYVWVRPSFTVDGNTVPADNDFANGQAVIKSPSIELVNRVLQIDTPDGNFAVDWSGTDPVFFGTVSKTADDVVFHEISIIPNPTADMVYFRNVPEDSRVLLVDLKGRNVLEKSASELNGGLSLQPYANGLYLIRVMKGQEHIKSVKIIKK